MVCWPVYLVGGFFISLLIVDMYNYKWDSLNYHAGIGILFTGLYYLFCVFLGNEISMAVLFVPAVFILMFIFTSWLFYKKIKDQNCCMTCDPNAPKTEAPAKPWSFPLMSEFTVFWNWLISDPPTKQCSKAT
jgi:Zn-dependent protease with chaperone function